MSKPDQEYSGFKGSFILYLQSEIEHVGDERGNLEMISRFTYQRMVVKSFRTKGCVVYYGH